MLMNENEKQRLLRLAPGSDADTLIEELAAMANDTQRQSFPNGIDVTPRDPLNPPIIAEFPDNGESQTLIRVNRGNNSFDIALNADNSLTINDQPISEGEDGGEAGPGTPGTSFPGQIVSYVGANVYTVRIYPSGLSGASSVVSVLQLQGDVDFPHTTGRWATVTRAGSSYYMNLPVWA